jgi:hypothetical protein
MNAATAASKKQQNLRIFLSLLDGIPLHGAASILVLRPAKSGITQPYKLVGE